MVTVSEFTNDMNQHANTSYRCIDGTYIIEYSHGPMSENDRVTVWRHQKDGGADEDAGEESYGHAWVKVVRVWGDPEEINETYQELMSEDDVLELRDEVNDV